MQFIITIFLIQFLRKSYKDTELRRVWNSRAVLVMVACGLFFIATSVNTLKHFPIVETIGNALLVLLYVFLWRKEEFAEHRNTFIMITPLVAAFVLQNLLKLIAPAFYKQYDAIFEGLELLSWLWLLGSWLVFRKQKKALDEERRKRREEEEKARLAALNNQMLEQMVAERTLEITEQKNQLEETLKELQSTQALLIQSEKMASLGELTAGIAHEIQNPLNFVNNFSEVNAELLDEAGEALQKDDWPAVADLLKNVKENQLKINQHGKRADAIVKGMLLHSRGTSTNTELTNINDLTDEYLRLAFHSMRAKEKSFNVDLVENFGKNLPSINIVPQDIGRVLLNIITNAFHAMNEKRIALQNDDYLPKLEVETSKVDRDIIIRIADNGNGIPEVLSSKVFMPFFTTKPTGQGTGLGLSISFDIVKAHGGTLRFESRQNEGTTFYISLPTS